MSVNKYGAAMHTDIYDRWQKPGDITNVPRLDGSESANFNAQSDRWLMSSDYLSMKSLTFAYTLPKAFLSKFAIKNARVSLSGREFIPAYFHERYGSTTTVQRYHEQCSYPSSFIYIRTEFHILIIHYIKH